MLASFCTYNLFKSFEKAYGKIFYNLSFFFPICIFSFHSITKSLVSSTPCNLKFSILSLRKTFVCLYGRDAAVTMRRNTLWRIQSTIDREANVKKIWNVWKPLKICTYYWCQRDTIWFSMYDITFFTNPKYG